MGDLPVTDKYQLVQAGEHGIVAYPWRWQTPAETEKQAYKDVLKTGGLEGATYVGFPWATLIDGLATRLPDVALLLAILNSVRDAIQPAARVVTVVQHILAARYAAIFHACGISDVLWSHKLQGVSQWGNIKLHPFPLFPAQLGGAAQGVDIPPKRAPKKYLANFIGAYNPKIYLTDVRQHILDEAGRRPTMLIIMRDAWHFDRAVYIEQMKGTAPEQATLDREKQHRDEYMDAIYASTFTLCPTGSGPNSIRIFESLGMGSIPVILTRTLHLPGSPTMWEAACVIEDDSVEGYRRSIETMEKMTARDIAQKLAAGSRLFEQVGPSAYGRLIQSAIR